MSQPLLEAAQLLLASDAARFWQKAATQLASGKDERAAQSLAVFFQKNSQVFLFIFIYFSFFAAARRLSASRNDERAFTSFFLTFFLQLRDGSLLLATMSEQLACDDLRAEVRIKFTNAFSINLLFKFRLDFCSLFLAKPV